MNETVSLPFRDRVEAAEQLARALQRWRGQHPLVVAIPRGAAPMGRIIADRLGGELDVVLVRKIPSTMNPELAIGAVDELGNRELASYFHRTHASMEWVEAKTTEQMDLMRRRRAAYGPSVDPRDRIVLVVDDGLATGSTMAAALRSLRSRDPRYLVACVPVASTDAVELIRPLCDEVVALATPRHFGAVGQFYASFPQVEEGEVVRLLGRHSSRA